MAEFSEVTYNLCKNQVDLSTRQMALALYCHDTGTKEKRQVKEIAAWLRISKPAITRAADRLADCGMLQREGLPEDRRACVLTLTSRGMKFVKAMMDGGTKAQL